MQQHFLYLFFVIPIDSNIPNSFLLALQFWEWAAAGERMQPPSGRRQRNV